MEVIQVMGTAVIDLTYEECAMLAKACDVAVDHWQAPYLPAEANLAGALSGAFTALTIAVLARNRMVSVEARHLQEEMTALQLKARTHTETAGKSNE